MRTSSFPERPDGPLRVVIDTDAANEIDDQFAIVWALLANDRLDVVAVNAAPYAHGPYLAALRSAVAERPDRTPATTWEEFAVALSDADIASAMRPDAVAEGMERSFDEIRRVLDIVEAPARTPHHRGSTRFMNSADDPVESDAAANLIEFAHASDEPLYVAVLGAPTNVAAALVLDPTIASKLVIVFVAGYPTASSHVDDSFNLIQDRVATNRLFAPDTNLVYIPGYHVAETLSVSLAELQQHAGGHGPVGELLVDLYEHNPLAADPMIAGHSWVMWDLAPIAWLIDPSWVRTNRTASANIGADHRWQSAPGEITEAFRIDRRAIYIDIFARLG